MNNYNQIKEWLAEPENTSERIDVLLHSVVTTVTYGEFTPRKIDERVLQCIRLARNAEEGTIQLQQILFLQLKRAFLWLAIGNC